MIASRRIRNVLLSLACLAAVMGCRKAEPPRPYYGDLGTDDTLLLPVASPWKDAQLKDGRADWHPFRVPGAPDDETEETGEETDEAAEETETGATAEIETELRELTAEYNELAGEATADDLIEFYVPDQRDTLKPALESALTANEKLAALTATLEEQLPDAGERIADAAQRLRTQNGILLGIESVTVQGDGEAAAKLVGGYAPGCTFRLLDDAWYIALDGAPEFEGLKQSTAALAEACDRWLTSLESNEISAEDVLSQMEAPAPTAAEEAPSEAEQGEVDQVEEDPVEEEEAEEEG